MLVEPVRRQLLGWRDAIERALAYEAIGVDAIFCVGIKTRDELDTIAERLSLPII